MQKIGIKIINIDEIDIKSVAMSLQLFIIDGDYKINSIIQQIKNQNIVVLDVSKEDNMPDFTDIAEEFDESNIEYKLYKNRNNSWKETTLDDLNLYRVPKLIMLSVIVVLLGYIVMGLIGTFCITNFYHTKYEFDYFIAFIGGAITSFIPIVGSTLSYISATELWHWSSLKASILFFGYYLPIVLFLLYILYIYAKYYWYRYKYPDFNS